MNFFRRLLHSHAFEHIGVTYSSPKLKDEYGIRNFEGPKAVLERLVHGVTAHLWKCADPACAETIVVVLPGLPLVEEAEAMTGRSLLQQLERARLAGKS